MRLVDWLGNEYGPGDRVLYAVGSGRSNEIQLAEVVDIWVVYRDPTHYDWKRLGEGEEVPFKRRYDYDVREYVDSTDRVETSLRVKLQPLGKGSRNFSTRADSKTVYFDPQGNEISRDEMVQRLEAEHGPQYDQTDIWRGWQRNWDYEDFGYSSRRDYVKPKPVTLTLGIDNITLLEPKEGTPCPECGSPNPSLHTFHVK